MELKEMLQTAHQVARQTLIAAKEKCKEHSDSKA
jgi:hypothetical protein